MFLIQLNNKAKYSGRAIHRDIKLHAGLAQLEGLTLRYSQYYRLASPASSGGGRVDIDRYGVVNYAGSKGFFGVSKAMRKNALTAYLASDEDIRQQALACYRALRCRRAITTTARVAIRKLAVMIGYAPDNRHAAAPLMSGDYVKLKKAARLLTEAAFLRELHLLLAERADDLRLSPIAGHAIDQLANVIIARRRCHREASNMPREHGMCPRDPGSECRYRATATAREYFELKVIPQW